MRKIKIILLSIAAILMSICIRVLLIGYVIPNWLELVMWCLPIIALVFIILSFFVQE